MHLITYRPTAGLHKMGRYGKTRFFSWADVCAEPSEIKAVRVKEKIEDAHDEDAVFVI